VWTKNSFMLTEWKDLSREVNVQHVEAISEETKCERKGKNSGGLGQTRHCNCRSCFEIDFQITSIEKRE